MSNILKIALIGGGAYLAYNYLQKRKQNNLELANAAKAPVLSDVAIAEGEEEGEEGMGAEMLMDIDDKAEMSNAVGGKLRRPRIKGIRGVQKRGMLRANGWDSDNISYGL